MPHEQHTTAPQLHRLLRKPDQTISYLPVLSEFLNPQQSLIGIWIGINDIGDSSKYNITGINGTANLTHPFASFPSFYNLILDTEFASVQQLYSTGYRNFIFFTLPPLDKTPGNILAGSKALPNATMVGWYNDAIASHTKVFQERNRDAKVMLFDAHEVLEGVLEDPGKYGIKNTTGYCVGYNQPDIQTDPGKYGCAPLEEYFWYNTGHLTSHVHSILAGELRDFLLRQ
ncbi:MAG: hypothetical protein M1820_000498 [Bogoriella megaspora]|nr:MAG: hypothetical protein M1820_000498 [Bogoriella megaspora]